MIRTVLISLVLYSIVLFQVSEAGLAGAPLGKDAANRIPGKEAALFRELRTRLESGGKLTMNGTACQALADTLGQIDNFIGISWNSILDTTSKWEAIIAEFPACVSWNPSTMIKCFRNAVDQAKNEEGTTEFMMEMMRDGLKELWQQLEDGVKACFG